MILRIKIQQFEDDNQTPAMNSFDTAVSLPWGCGMDFARQEIEKTIKAFRVISEELFIAHTEGREIDPAFVDQLPK